MVITIDIDDGIVDNLASALAYRSRIADSDLTLKDNPESREDFIRRKVVFYLQDSYDSKVRRDDRDGVESRIASSLVGDKITTS